MDGVGEAVKELLTERRAVLRAAERRALPAPVVPPAPAETLPATGIGPTLDAIRQDLQQRTYQLITKPEVWAKIEQDLRCMDRRARRELLALLLPILHPAEKPVLGPAQLTIVNKIERPRPVPAIDVTPGKD